MSRLYVALFVLAGLVLAVVAALSHSSSALSAGSTQAQALDSDAPPVALLPLSGSLAQAKRSSARTGPAPQLEKRPDDPALDLLPPTNDDSAMLSANSAEGLPESTAETQQQAGGICATIYPVGDSDTYYFDARAGDRIQIRMYRTSGQLDPFLSLYDPAGRYVDDDDDSGGNYNAMIDTVVPTTGRYYVVAAAYCCNNSPSYFTGGYCVTVNVVADPHCPGSGGASGVILYDGAGYSGRSLTYTAGFHQLPSYFDIPQSVRFDGMYRIGWVVEAYSTICPFLGPCFQNLVGAVRGNTSNTGWFGTGALYVDIHQ